MRGRSGSGPLGVVAQMDWLAQPWHADDVPAVGASMPGQCSGAFCVQRSQHSWLTSRPCGATHLWHGVGPRTRSIGGHSSGSSQRNCRRRLGECRHGGGRRHGDAGVVVAVSEMRGGGRRRALCTASAIGGDIAVPRARARLTPGCLARLSTLESASCQGARQSAPGRTLLASESRRLQSRSLPSRTRSSLASMFRSSRSTPCEAPVLNMFSCEHP